MIICLNSNSSVHRLSAVSLTLPVNSEHYYSCILKNLTPNMVLFLILQKFTNLDLLVNGDIFGTSISTVALYIDFITVVPPEKLRKESAKVKFKVVIL